MTSKCTTGCDIHYLLAPRAGIAPDSQSWTTSGVATKVVNEVLGHASTPSTMEQLLGWTERTAGRSSKSVTRGRGVEPGESPQVKEGSLHNAQALAQALWNHSVDGDASSGIRRDRFRKGARREVSPRSLPALERSRSEEN